MAWALPRAAGVRSLAARYTAAHQDTELQARHILAEPPSQGARVLSCTLRCAQPPLDEPCLSAVSGRPGSSPWKPCPYLPGCQPALASQVLVGLFGSSLRLLDLMPGAHGPAPFQQATVNLLAYCTGARRALLRSTHVQAPGNEESVHRFFVVGFTEPVLN